MPKIFIKELDNIKKMILSLGAMVEERVRLAAEAVENKDAEAAQRIIKTDYEIDEMEVEIEEEDLSLRIANQVALPPITAAPAVAAASLPVAGNVFILAQHYGVAPQRVSASILVSTAVSVVTVSAVIAWVSTI